MTGEGERVDLDMYIRILVALAGWGKRDLPRRPGPPRFRGEELHSLPLRILCGLVFR